MIDLEIPLGKRTATYRLFELLPATLSYGSLILLVVLSLWNPLLAAIYLMLVIFTVLVKALGIAIHTISGRRRLERAQRVDWRGRLMDLEDPATSYDIRKGETDASFGFKAHVENLRLIAADPVTYPRPSELYNAVIVATYNESYDTLAPTIQSLLDATYDSKRLILVIGYEERGGDSTRRTVERVAREFSNQFYALHVVMHPDKLPNEVVGKGANITYAGKWLQQWLDKKKIPYRNVMITTLDSDNRPHPAYFDYVLYEYIVRDDRKRLSYQPVSLYTNNIWDAPAPMRVIATGNSFWNVISSMRPHTLRNFASHSQPMDALVEMNFWSTRTIVEDGHQYWRSYFHFAGDYEVIPIYAPIYQDAVLAETYSKTLKAQFRQLQRWAYGASDIPYVASRLFSRQRNIPFIGGLARLVRLIDGHLTLASASLLVAFGGWVPLLINGEAARNDVIVHQLPDVISIVQRFAMIGLFVTVFLSFKMLPPRPERYRRTRTIWMLLQWALMPITAIIYSSSSALYSQGRLFLGKYLEVFIVTAKATKSDKKKR